MRRLLVVVVLALAGCHQTRASTPIVDHTRPAKPLGELHAAEAAAAVDSVYRLLPDRRMLLAIRDIYALQRGRSASVDVDFENNEWKLRCDGRDAGRLPLIPSFRDGLAMLTAWSASLGKLPDGPLAPKTRAAGDSLFAAAKELGKPSRGSIAAAARIAIDLEQQMSGDTFELGDPVAARALALLAMARAAGSRSTNEEAARLASALGYETEGRELAATPLDRSPAKLPDIIAAAENAAAQQRQLTQEVTGTAHDDEEPGVLARAYESAIGRHAAEVASPLLDASVARAFYDAAYYTALERQLRLDTDHRGSEPAARHFIEALGRTDDQPGHDVRAALSIIVTTMFGSGQYTTSKQLLALTNVGAGFRAERFIPLSRMHGYDAADRDAEPVLFSLLDSRPTQRLQAGWIASQVICDPLRRDLYIQSALQAAPQIAKPGEIAFFADLTGDLPALRQLAMRADVAPADRAIAAKYLAGAGDAESADRAFDALFRESDYDEFFSTWAGVMNARRDWRAKERAARRWLDGHRELDIQHAYYTASLADALERQGRYAEAWKLVEPEVGVWSEVIVERAVSLLQRLGRVSESDELGEQLVKRYPDGWTRSGYAAVLWRQKRWRDAAALFDPKQASIPISTWRESVLDDMMDAFEHASSGDVAAAVGALADAGVHHDFFEMIPRTFTKRGHPDLAFAAAEELCRRYPLKFEPVSAQLHVEAYRALAAWKGKDAAMAWLRPRLNDQNALEVVSLFFENDEDEAVLALADFAPRVRTDEMHCYLAQSMTRLRLPPNDPRVIALRNELAAKPVNPKSLDPAALYLLGDMSEKDFLAWPYEPSGQTIAAYMVALKSASAGDYDRALPYMIAARYGTAGTPPQLWAVGRLNDWGTRRMRWRDLAAKRIL